MIHFREYQKTYHNGAPLHVLKGINLDIKEVSLCLLRAPPVR